jgi:hypothetical protein
MPDKLVAVITFLTSGFKKLARQELSSTRDLRQATDASRAKPPQP